VPVIAWIAGAIVSGGAQEFSGGLLAANRPVIVVTFDYRLGPLGFFALSSLNNRGDKDISGNYGILDQQAALRWVRRNIAGFGGDPHRVTILGVSAGGVCVCAHLLSPVSADLFQRAVMESAPCGWLNGASARNLYASNMAAAQLLAARLGSKLACDKTSDVMACMRSRPAKMVVSALPIEPGRAPIWAPMIDGRIISGSALQQFGKGQFNHVPLINGSNHDEGTFMVYRGYAGLMKAAAPDAAKRLYPLTISMAFNDKAPLVLARYPAGQYPTPARAYAVLWGDWLSCGIHQVTRALAPWTPTFAYEFNDKKAPPFFSDPDFDWGASHGSEVQYILRTPFPHLPERALLLSPEQLGLSDRMMDYWTQFAAGGRPDGTPAWTRYDPQSDNILSLAPGAVRFESNFARDHQCVFWDALGSQ
jgi:para-nitrobenzyl esterase